MKAILNVSAAAVFLLVAASPCFALWEIAPVSKDRAKELGMEVRWWAAGPNDVRVELEFKIAGELKDFSRVDLRVGKGDKVVVAALKEDRSKPGRVIVSLSAARTRVDEINLWVMVPQRLGGSAYEVRLQDFVELEKAR
jgi:translation initiation factor IF-1